MRMQNHEYIPPWVTKRAQLRGTGWYRVCGTLHRFGILLYGGSISIETRDDCSFGSWIVSYGFWNGTYLEAMFVAPLSLSSDISIGYERTHYCAGPYVVQWGRYHTEIDNELDSLLKQSWMFITAENPYSQYTPDQNQSYNLKLKSDLDCSNFRCWDGWGIPHFSGWVPEASFLVLGVDQETALIYKQKYQQKAVVFGKKGDRAIFL